MRCAKLLAASVLVSGLTILGTGCQGRASIPAGANVVQSGSGGLSYTAHQAGNAYVLDSDSDKKVFEGHMNNGDQLVLKPSEDQIILAGNNADHSVSLKPDHRYSIYFTPDQ